MKRFIFSLVVLLGILNVNFAQGNSFEWSDSTFTVGAKKEIEVIPVRYCDVDINNDSIVSIIGHFMNENPMLKVSIVFHSDFRGSNKANQALTQRRAEQFCKYLKYSGIDKNRLTAIGMGENQPLITIEEIEQLKTEEEKEKAHARNRRVEVQIKEI